jgi:predicted glutamine amidotransferase
MCRLFGLISNKPSNISYSMLEAQKSFKSLGEKNPDGWGLGWYKSNGMPVIEKYGKNVLESSRFNELVSEIGSEIIVTHIRKASPKYKIISDRDAQPFIYQNWIFAHNGTLNREEFFNILIPPFNKELTSQPIDSEIYFRLLVQNIGKYKDVTEAIKYTTIEVNKYANGTNFILTDGFNLWAYRCNRTLFYLCRNNDYEEIKSSKEIGFLVSSEVLTDENWIEIKNNSLLEINKKLQYKITDFENQ